MPILRSPKQIEITNITINRKKRRLEQAKNIIIYGNRVKRKSDARPQVDSYNS